MSRASNSTKFYLAVLTTSVAFGALPVALNLAVDPYNKVGGLPLAISKKKISEQAHYPLWKIIAHSKKQAPEIIILGDSRARALRDKYWSEVGLKRAFNFAYGGATIYEVYETFKYLKTKPKPKNLVVGIQLRSFDPAHKGGMNRVPEAIRLANQPVKYFSSWFVTKISWRHIEANYPTATNALKSLVPNIISSAQAAELGRPGKTPVSTLLQPDVCFGCKLPQLDASVAYPLQHRGYGRGYGRWAGLWQHISINRDLPSKFAKQVRKNGRSDWKSFKFSEDLWAKVAEIADWSSKNGVQLVFVIPPTIPEMQARIAEFGRTDLNRQLRLRLAALAPVIDLDFDNKFTRKLGNFTDAYHFGPAAARNIVAEVGRLLTADPKVHKNALKVRSGLTCPISSGETTNTIDDGIVTFLEGQNCRVWRKSNGPA